jgi:hypothetical protein
MYVGLKRVFILAGGTVARTCLRITLLRVKLPHRTLEEQDSELLKYLFAHAQLLLTDSA